MNKIALAFGFALAATSATAQAASHEHDMSQHQMAAQPAASPAAQKGIGVLKAVNAQAGKVQIAHEPIAELGWPAMTMWFMLKTPLPQDIKIGDSVRFEMIEGDKKQWTIVKIARE